MFLNCGTSLLVVIQTLGIKLQKSCEHAYGPHNILWRAACGPRAAVCPPLHYALVRYAGKTLLVFILAQRSNAQRRVCVNGP